MHQFLAAIPRDSEGNPVPPGARPAARTAEPNEWTSEEKHQFKTADFTYRKASLSGPLIDELLELWEESLEEHGASAPFASHTELYAFIDSIKHGDAPWYCLLARWTGPIEENAPSWKRREYPVLYRDTDVVCTNMLDSPTFANGFDTVPYVEVNRDDQRQWGDFMSGNFAYNQAVHPLPFSVLLHVLIHRRRQGYTMTIPQPKARCTVPLFSAATRRLFPSPPVI